LGDTLCFRTHGEEVRSPFQGKSSWNSYLYLIFNFRLHNYFKKAQTKTLCIYSTTYILTLLNICHHNEPSQNGLFQFNYLI
jgi:hypothetical protein